MPAHHAVVICKSVHHQSTARVAQRIAEVLDAVVVTPEEMPTTILDDYDLIGFGSGVYHGRFHPALWDWIRGLPRQSARRKPAFVFSTSGLPSLWRLWHGPFTKELARRGFDIVGQFHCRGFDSWGPLSLLGGINRRHPNEHDLERAARFAQEITTKRPPSVAMSA